jgi:hypothetical protein
VGALEKYNFEYSHQSLPGKNWNQTKVG